jgi:RNA polymerase sigma-70 factor (ECF subfamily)
LTSSDETHIRDVLAGNREAFAPLVEKYRRAALACAIATLGGVSDAEDVAQEAFVRAFTHLNTCRDHARFGAWLLTIVKRLALNHARALRRRPTRPLDPEKHAQSTAIHASSTHAPSDRAALWRALGRLPAHQREVLLLADLEHLSHAEIAQRTGLSVFMSRRHLSDARRMVLAYLRTSHVE